MDKLPKQSLTLEEIKDKIKNSARLEDLKASMERFKNHDEKLLELQRKNSTIKPRTQKFENIQLETPVGPQKAYRSPTKNIFSDPTKKKKLSTTTRRPFRIFFEPEESTLSPIKESPTEAPAYQRYYALAESTSLPLPYNYKFLAEAFKCMDTASATLIDEKKTITFNELKSAIQKLLMRNFTMEQLAQIKTIYPDAYNYHQEKCHTFETSMKEEMYELVVTPVCQPATIEENTEKCNEKTSVPNMSPEVLLERNRKFYNNLLERVKDEHEKFLLNLETPMNIPQENIIRWHPEFDVNICKTIECADLPQPPNLEKVSSAKHMLEKTLPCYNKTALEKESSQTTQTVETGAAELEASVVDTPPTTLTAQCNSLAMMFKTIPKTLFEKVRAKQAAKSLAIQYSWLPEVAELLRNIFVAEQKGVLSLKFVLAQLGNLFATQLTLCELEELVRLLCKLLPTWVSIRNVQEVEYLKLVRNVNLLKIIQRLQVLANDKVTPS